MSENPDQRQTDPLSFWREQLLKGQLSLQYCERCRSYQHYPRKICANCWHSELQWRTASGEGEIYSYTIARVPTSPELADKLPYVIAIVELSEGPRLTSNILDCVPEQVHIGMSVQAVFPGDRNEESLLQFRPSR